MREKTEGSAGVGGGLVGVGEKVRAARLRGLRPAVGSAHMSLGPPEIHWATKAHT